MGRRLRGAKLRAEKRSKLAGKELVDAKADETETQHVTSKQDEELFVIDTDAVEASKKQQTRQGKKKRKYTASAKEQTQIQKLIDTHSAKALDALAQTTTAKRARIKGKVAARFDLWGDVDTAIQSKSKKPTIVSPAVGSTFAGIKPSEHCKFSANKALPPPRISAVTVEVAKAGQSYNPDKVEHKKEIEEAVKVESKRLEAEDLKKAPIGTGMSAETKALLIGDSDTDDSDLEGDSENVDGDSSSIVKKKEKLTRAQRNKQKRLREEDWRMRERKNQKKLQNSVAEAKTIAKKMRKEASRRQEEKERIRKLKAESERTKGKNVYQQISEENPIGAPTFPVALSNELKSGSSLRTLRPKGSLITDRMISFMDRDMATKMQVKKKKRVEGKRRKMKLKVKGKGFAESRDAGILG